jgi:hypothetical protein
MELFALTENHLMEAFRIFGELSPENLCCDGELPMAQVRVKERKLRADLKALEARVGMKLDECAVYREYQRRRGLKIR